MDYQKQLKKWEKRREEIRGLHVVGYSMAEIARKLKITRQRVYQIVREVR
jgi:predicted DNA-binding protein YlxM (UPF0122 family)